MDFVTLFDVVVVSLVLILGIKGVISGLIKEIFGLIGLIGGIVVASRFGIRVGHLISDNVYKIEGDSILFFNDAYRILDTLPRYRRIFIEISRVKWTWIFG